MYGLTFIFFNSDESRVKKDLHLNRKRHTFVTIRPATLLIRTAQTGGLYCFYSLMQFTKPPLSINDQITLLRQRGLQIPDIPKAIHYLSNISYYRFKVYTYPFQDNTYPNFSFVSGTTFDQILDLYLFDKSLRGLVFDALQEIEVALRTQITNHFAFTYGSHWYQDPNLYQNARHFNRDMNTFDKEINRSTDTFILNYKRTYTQPTNPPVWMTFEIISLGLLSKIYENLRNSPEKNQVARHFGLPVVVLISWMHMFNYVRNLCAHHSRLWNRQIVHAPRLPRRPHRQWLNQSPSSPYTPYVTLSAILYMLNAIDPQHKWKQDLKNLISNSNISLSDMGFPQNWTTEPLWV